MSKPPESPESPGPAAAARTARRARPRTAPTACSARASNRRRVEAAEAEAEAEEAARRADPEARPSGSPRTMPAGATAETADMLVAGWTGASGAAQMCPRRRQTFSSGRLEARGGVFEKSSPRATSSFSPGRIDSSFEGSTRSTPVRRARRSADVASTRRRAPFSYPTVAPIVRTFDRAPRLPTAPSPTFDDVRRHYRHVRHLRARRARIRQGARVPWRSVPRVRRRSRNRHAPLRGAPQARAARAVLSVRASDDVADAPLSPAEVASPAPAPPALEPVPDTFSKICDFEDLPRGDRRKVDALGKSILIFWYKDSVVCIESRSPAEGAFSEGFTNARLTQDGCIVCPSTASTLTSARARSSRGTPRTRSSAVSRPSRPAAPWKCSPCSPARMASSWT